MSVAVTALLWKLRLPLTEKMVLVRLGDFGSDDGTNIFPAVQTVADECGISDRAVQITIKKLLASGILILIGSAAGGRGRTTEYAIDLDRVRHLIENPEPRSPIKEPEKGEKGENPERRSQNPERRSPEPLVTTSSEEAGASSGADGADEPAPPSDADLVWGKGLSWLAKAAGKPPASMRGLVGRWCKGGREAVVLALMRECREHSPPIVDPVPWIETALANRNPDHVRQAQDRQHRPAPRTYGEDPDTRRRAILDGLAHRMGAGGAAA